jgi:hypothetical protein
MLLFNRIHRLVTQIRLVALFERTLPPQPTHLPNRRRARGVLLTAGAAIVALHLALALAAELSRTVRDPVYADKERKLSRLERQLPPASPLVLFLGTSRTANGFAAGQAQEVLSANLGRPVAVFNWGLPATGPVAHLLHLRRLLADQHKPSVLLLEIHPPTLAELPDGLLEGRLANGMALEWDELDTVAGYQFPMDRLRQCRREAIRAPWYGLRFQIMGRLSPSAVPYYLRYDAGRGPDPNGWSPIIVDQVTEELRATGRHQAKLEYEEMLGSLRIGEPATRALREILDLCRHEGIPVLFIWMPEGTSFRAMYPPSVSMRLESFLKGLALQYGCSVCNARDWLADDFFMDGHHILREKAPLFSQKLAHDVIEPFLRKRMTGKP